MTNINMAKTNCVFNIPFAVILFLLLICCFQVSYGVCFTNTCSHQNLTDCVTGHYVCQTSEFCEVTSIYTSGSSRVIMDCRPSEELTDCEALSVHSKTSVCSPGQQQQEVCHWCCPDAQCLRQLAHGVFPNSHTTTTTATTTSTPLSCVQCGDYDMRTPCTDAELLVDHVTLCADTTASGCMTDVFTDSAGSFSIYKRCVHDQPCRTLWYTQSSDRSSCLYFDSARPIAGLTCHFCCVVDGCNVDIVPGFSTLWRP